ncbi:hypothetical protein BZA70DRAFT_298728 [Myxozyma melibiosi]|uniref:NFACT RNA-binding domain-containing protein n=1 Tax=Myxozyma melibiosi TaxID=54550 RepID=A0ABR1F9S9_9ASCO
MVYYFTSKREDVDRDVMIYMGKHKEENEDLIKYGLDSDLWFHVDKLSSAHVYLRMNPGEEWDSLPEGVLEDCAQLTKANSIEGNKRDNITVIYTPWSNLKKTNDMAVGQVGFKQNKMVKKVHIPVRVNAIVNRLNKTKVEKFPDLQAEKIEYEKEKNREARKAFNERYKREKAEAEARRKEKWEKDHAYEDLFSEENLAKNSNQNRGEGWVEDDFW